MSEGIEIATASARDDRRRRTPERDSRAALRAARIGVGLATALLWTPIEGAAQTVAPSPGQVQTQPQGPIVGGQRLQPRPDQLPDPDISDADAKRLRELSREVLEASDPSKLSRRRQHQ